MIHDLTLEQKIEVAAEQIENSLDVVFSDEKKQIRLILTQFAQVLVSGVNTSDEPALPIQSVVCSALPEDEENKPYCTDCGNEDLEYIDQYANGDFWRCKECKKEFIH